MDFFDCVQFNIKLNSSQVVSHKILPSGITGQESLLIF